MTNHDFEPSYTGMVCDVMVMRDGGGDQCGLPAAEHIQPPFPMFEGKPVDAATLKVSTGAALEIDDEVVRMDDVVVIQIECVVEQVDHRVHRASGRLVRYQVARPLSARVVTRE